MSSFTAVLDACVLYPACLRDLLLNLSIAGIYRAKWTDQIHDEWISSLTEDRPDLETRLARTRQLMNEAVPDCLVTGYEDLVDSLTLPDSNDRHVMAAAIRANADTIVTFNKKDFPDSELEKFDIYAEHPDDFVFNMITLEPGKVVPSVQEQRERLKRPPVSVDDFLIRLTTTGLVQSAIALRDYEAVL